MYALNSANLMPVQELLWRTGLLTAHFDQWAKQGYEVDDSQKAETRKPSQEALMKLFAVSNVNKIYW